MKNKIMTTILLLSSAIASGYFLYSILKVMGLGDSFHFDLFEDVDEEDEF